MTAYIIAYVSTLGVEHVVGFFMFAPLMVAGLIPTKVVKDEEEEN